MRAASPATPAPVDAPSTGDAPRAPASERVLPRARGAHARAPRPDARASDPPKRRRLYDLILAQPGTHLRELQRRLGGGWGSFRCHLTALEKSGNVRVFRTGGVKVAYPTGAAPPVAIHPTAARLLCAIPSGEAWPARAVAQRLGISPQLVLYHARNLARSGLLDLVPGPAGTSLLRCTDPPARDGSGRAGARPAVERR